MSNNWRKDGSPFHDGERQAQLRHGVRDQVEELARRVVRDHMPNQHRDFYTNLPFILLGAVDDKGRPWASIITGTPGFLTTPNATTLDIEGALLAGDPLRRNLKSGAAVGLLGFDPETRRRNRITGRIVDMTQNGLRISVGQAFGNCPQYIQTRRVVSSSARPSPAGPDAITKLNAFDDRSRKLIEAADTFFIASAYGSQVDDTSHGADVSHRGGKPGFVRVEDERTFVFPDFSGNNHFNTVGNLLRNPKAGFLFIDFDSGDLLYLTGTATIAWEGLDLQAFAGAERLIRCVLEEAIFVEHGLPLSFAFGTYSPVLSRIGDWEAADTYLTNQAKRNAYVEYEIYKIVRESDVISSFYLRRSDGKALTDYEPGQFLPIQVNIPGHDEPVRRTYTISDAANGEYYRLSIKREGGDALVSNHLHAHATPGFRLTAMAPRGKFILDETSERPAVFLSAGVGLTPMIAMLNKLIGQTGNSNKLRRMTFIHASQNSRTQAFAEHLRVLEAQHDNLTVHVRYSDPVATDEVGVTHDGEGLISTDIVRQLLPLDDYDFYLCGPPPFMTAMFTSLIELGVREERIRYESFGPATRLKVPDAMEARKIGTGPEAEPVAVRFAQSDVEATWKPEAGTLLDLAEAAGINPAYSCRSGVCGACATRLISGAISYAEAPIAEVSNGEILICCAVPNPQISASDPETYAKEVASNPPPESAQDSTGKSRASVGVVLDL